MARPLFVAQSCEEEHKRAQQFHWPIPWTATPTSGPSFQEDPETQPIPLSISNAGVLAACFLRVLRGPPTFF